MIDERRKRGRRRWRGEKVLEEGSFEVRVRTRIERLRRTPLIGIERRGIRGR